MDAIDFIEKIETKRDFLKFVELLEIDLSKNKGVESGWENDTLESYFSGMYGFVLDMESYYKNKGEKVDLSKPTWRNFAHILMASTIYE